MGIAIQHNKPFFEKPYEHFFRPLNGKYRDAAVNCIRAFYLRLNGPEADYDYHQSRRDVIECFVAALRDSRVLDPDGEDNGAIDSAGSNTDRATAMLQTLLESGWLEKYSDPGSMRSAYRFTPRGRQFARIFVQGADEIVTRTQSTRSTLAHLRTFADGAKAGHVAIPDLMIAAKLSQDIVGDLNDIIEEVTEHKRRFADSVTRDLEHARATGESFFKYMGQRFVPDLEARFNEDSVERYRADILSQLESIEALPTETKRSIERSLRQYYPSLLQPGRRSILIWVLDRIRTFINRACDAKLPELRRETRTFVRRADALLKHLTTITFEGDEQTVGQRVAGLLRLSEPEVNAVLTDPRSHLPELKVELIDPARVRLRERKREEPIDDTIDEPPPLSREARLADALRRELARIFQVDVKRISEFVVQELAGGHRIRISQMNITDVPSMLASLHAAQIAGVQNRESLFQIVPLNERFCHELFETDDYVIEYVPEARGRG